MVRCWVFSVDLRGFSVVGYWVSWLVRDCIVVGDTVGSSHSASCPSLCDVAYGVWWCLSSFLVICVCLSPFPSPHHLLPPFRGLLSWCWPHPPLPTVPFPSLPPPRSPRPSPHPLSPHLLTDPLPPSLPGILCPTVWRRSIRQSSHESRPSGPYAKRWVRMDRAQERLCGDY